jgi:hypothetical protein
MFFAPALAMLLAAAPGAADSTFNDRMTQGKLAEAAATGPAYQKALWGKIGNPTTDALKGCIASNAPANKSPFTLVADILPDGKPARIEVLPPTPVANCMAGQFAGWTLPAPPKQPAPYPIEIDFSIVP